jgi:hypothetical protein
LKIYLLVNGDYLESQISPNFPDIPIARAWEVGSLQALEELEST